MKRIEQLYRSFDVIQQKNRFLGFTLAVSKKYSDDESGNLAALITYFGFVSLFPLLLVLFSILNVLSKHDVNLQKKILNATLHYFPGASQQIYNNIHNLHSSGISLIIGIFITIYGARGVANALQNASNNLWQIPKDKRPNFWTGNVRSLGIIVFGGGGMIISTLALSYLTNLSNKGIAFKITASAVSFLLNIMVFTVIFRLATVSKVQTRWLVYGAAVAAIFWQILQSVGSFLILHQLRRTSEFYGVFSIVLGMLFWIYLQAEVTLYAIEINVVRVKKLWPRKLTADPRP